MWEYLIARLTILITFGFGILLIVLYPIIKKENKVVALISLIAGALIILFLFCMLLNNPAIRGQIFRYGLS